MLLLIRGGWDGIISTRYEPISEDNPEPHFSDVKLSSIKFCINNGRGLDDVPLTVLQKVEEVLSLPPPPLESWKYGIDATACKLHVERKVVWFQCPWSDDPGDLIAKFLRDMASMQTTNDYALIGIANYFPYTLKYKLRQFMAIQYDGVKVLDGNLEYKCVGADETLIKKLLQYGYKHVGRQDIHNTILNYHVTLVFQRR